MSKKNQTKQKIITGLHVLGEIYTKEGGANFLLAQAKKIISKIIKENGLRELGNSYYQFPKAGFSGIINVVESHIAVHTWPELNYVTLDVYVCNFRKDNSDACKKVFNEISKIFKPLKITKRLIWR